MKFYFEDKGLLDLYRTGYGKYPREVIISFMDRMRAIKSAKDERELREIKGNYFKKLKGFESLYSIRLNNKYRIELSIEKDGEIKVISIKRISNHYS